MAAYFIRFYFCANFFFFAFHYFTEWPELLSIEIIKLLDVPCKVALKQAENRPKLARK